MKLYINAPFSKECLEIIANAAKSSGMEICNDANDADMIVGTLPQDFAGGRLKLLQLPFAGVESVLADPRAKDLPIANASGAFGTVISEYIVGAILSFNRGLFSYRENQQRHIWRDIPCDSLVYGSRALILGCGDIGCAAAQRLRALGAFTAGIRKGPRRADGFDEVYGISALDEQLEKADYIICCLPHTPLTVGLLDKDRLARVKDGALLINVGRGSLIDTDALIAALDSRKLRGAVLDVTEQEPLPENSPLWDMPEVLITPHISGRSFGHSLHTERLIAEICAENIKRFANGKPLKNIVSKETGYADARSREK